MANPTTSAPLVPASIATAHAKISPYIHRTPLLTSQTIDAIASSSDPAAWLSDDKNVEPSEQKQSSSSTSHTPNGASPSSSSSPSDPPQFRLFFKAENYQKIGAFKARGAFHAVTRLIETVGLEKVKKCGVVTHSSGNHAQALALAAHTFDIPAYIVMPSISTPSKIAGTRRYTDKVIFSGSTSTEREAVVEQVRKETGALLVPPYDHPDIVLGQGTTGKEMEEQVLELQQQRESVVNGNVGNARSADDGGGFDAVIAPIGGGGLLGGIATWFSDKPQTRVFGAEPSFEGADDARRGLQSGQRVEHVKSLTIADGLRTPVGLVNWGIVNDKSKLEGVYSVGEEEIKMAMRLVFERMKVVVEPSGCVALAVVLFNREFREWVAKQQDRQESKVWDVGVVFSGGNTTMEAIGALFADGGETREGKRVEGKVGMDGKSKVEDVAG